MNGLQCDVAVIGRGFSGLAVARELQLQRPAAGVVVLERERLIAAHQTGHNSSVIHAGLYYRPDSLKASVCRRGADALYDYCARHGIPAHRCGKLVIARRSHELHALAIGVCSHTARMAAALHSRIPRLPRRPPVRRR